MSRRLRGESGFSLTEAIMAMVVFTLVSAALGAILTGAVSTNRRSHERTIAQQLATDKIEGIRQLGYDDVGTTSGNPPGTVVTPDAIATRGLNGTVTTRIEYVADATPTSYTQLANYKKVTVTVTNQDGRVLAKEITTVAPDARAPYGGLNWVAINPTVTDYVLAQPLPGATVTMQNGPSSDRSDVTDSAGKVLFSALDPNNVSPADFYDLTASLSGYVMLDKPSATHLSLSAGQTSTTTVEMYRPVQADVSLVDSTTGSPLTGSVTLRIRSTIGGTSYLYTSTTGSVSITDLGGVPLIPANYTIDGFSSGASPLCAQDIAQYVPSSYPTTLVEAIQLNFAACPTGTVQVTVTSGGTPLASQPVSISGGPYPMSAISGTTNSSGVVTFVNIPEGTGYTLSTTSGGTTATANADVVAGSTTTTALPITLYGNVTVTVIRGTGPLAGATVTVAGGPAGISPVTGIANSSGVVTFNNLQAGSGYTWKAWRTGCSGSTNRSLVQTAQTVTSGNSNKTMTLTNPACPAP
jgi:type II secretory pathway pseudopilin PulG